LIHFHPEVEVIRVPYTRANGCVGEVRRGKTTLQIIPWGLRDVNVYRGEQSPLQGWYAPRFGMNVENSVWGFRHTVDLPAWAGYVLWPGADRVAVDVTSHGDGSGMLTVMSDSGSRNILFDSRGIPRFTDSDSWVRESDYASEQIHGIVDSTKRVDMVYQRLEQR
jgi:hypothetical protein